MSESGRGQSRPYVEWDDENFDVPQVINPELCLLPKAEDTTTPTGQARGQTVARITIDDYPVGVDIKADIIVENPLHAVFNRRQDEASQIEYLFSLAHASVQQELEKHHPINPKAAVKLLFDYFEEINPKYAELMRTHCNTDALKTTLVESCMQNGISVYVLVADMNVALEAVRKRIRTIDVRAIQHYMLSKKARTVFSVPPLTFEDS